MLRSSAVTPVYATRSVNGHLAAVSHAHLTRRNGTDVCAGDFPPRGAVHKPPRETDTAEVLPKRKAEDRSYMRYNKAVRQVASSLDLHACRPVCWLCALAASLDESGRDHGITI